MKKYFLFFAVAMTLAMFSCRETPAEGSAEDALEETMDAAEDAAEDVKDAAEDAGEAIEEAVEEAGEAIDEATEEGGGN